MPEAIRCGQPKVIVRAFGSFSETRIIFMVNILFFAMSNHKLSALIGNSTGLSALNRELATHCYAATAI